jgi:hypothetical protein
MIKKLIESMSLIDKYVTNSGYCLILRGRSTLTYLVWIFDCTREYVSVVHALAF